ncbi:MAG: hypothetical protein AB7O59_19100 [Pirellulales bacterium]
MRSHPSLRRRQAVSAHNRHPSGSVRLKVESLEDRQLLAVTPWTIDTDASSITLVIPDQPVTYNGFNFTAQVRNQSGPASNPWTTNTAHITGQIVTDYTDGSEITFLTGQSSMSGVTSGSYRPNPAAFNGIEYTDTSTAAAEFGARLLAFGLTAAYASVGDIELDADSTALPIALGSFPANTLTFGALDSTFAVDGVEIFLIGQVIPDDLATLSLSGTNTASSGSVASLGGLQRQLTLPLNIPIVLELSEGTPPLTGSITGQIVATTTLPESTSVVGRHVFYNRSAFDGNDVSINSADDAAIAIDKTAYLPGDGLAGFQNITSYSRGVNGIMVDLAPAGGSHASITASDFVFKVGANNAPDTWAMAPAPSAVSVRTGAGVSGSDRVEITWADGAIQNQWLLVGVSATANTGLAATATVATLGGPVSVGDVFFFGNRIGDTGSPSATSFTTTTADASTIIAGGLGGAGGITNVRDIDKSNTITVAGDRAAALGNIGALNRLNVGTGGPFAPEDGDAGIASALATATTSAPAAALPPGIARRLSRGDLSADRIAAYFRQLAESDGRRFGQPATAAEVVDDALELDDELVAALSSGL